VLGPITGRTIDRLTLRRDGASPPLMRGQSRLKVSISVAPFASIDEASPRFAENRTEPAVIVFDATVNLPAAPRLPHRNAAGWTAPDVVTIPFSTGFRYDGGVLCIELEGEPAPGNTSTWWPIDCESDGIQGTRTVIGQGCGPVPATPSATVAERSLRAGATPELLHVTTSDAASLLGLAIQPLSVPIDLTPFGAPGCVLHVAPDVAVPVGVRGNHLGRGIGSARCALHIPNGPASLGATLYVQWFDATPQGLAVSNGLRLDVAAAPAWLDAAMVSSVPVASGALPDSGRLDVGVMPVVQLGLQ